MPPAADSGGREWAGGDAAGCWFRRGADAMGHADPADHPRLHHRRPARVRKVAGRDSACWFRRGADAMGHADPADHPRLHHRRPARVRKVAGGVLPLAVLEARELAGALPAPPGRPHRWTSARVSRMGRPQASRTDRPRPSRTISWRPDDRLHPGRPPGLVWVHEWPAAAWAAPAQPHNPAAWTAHRPATPHLPDSAPDKAPPKPLPAIKRSITPETIAEFKRISPIPPVPRTPEFPPFSARVTACHKATHDQLPNRLQASAVRMYQVPGRSPRSTGQGRHQALMINFIAVKVTPLNT